MERHFAFWSIFLVDAPMKRTSIVQQLGLEVYVLGVRVPLVTIDRALL